jgi:hypothetical protein
VPPQADPVVATVVIPPVGDLSGAVADLDLEPGRGLQVEAEHAVVLVTAEPVRDGQVRRPRAVEGGPDVVALVQLEHDVVEVLRQCERRPRHCERVVSPVAVVEAHLEVDPRGELGLEPVRLGEAEAVGEELVGLVERRRGEDRVPEAHAVGEEAARDEGGGEGSGRVGRLQHDLDLDPPRRRRPHEPLHPPLATVAVYELGTDALQSGDDGVERRRIHRLDPDGDRVVGRAGLHEQPVGPLVVAPGAGAGRRPLARHETDDVAEHRRERVGVGDLQDEVAEFDLVVHRVVLSCCQAGAAKSRAVLERSASSSESMPAMRSAPAAATGSGVNG